MAPDLPMRREVGVYIVGGDVQPRLRRRFFAAAGAFHALGGIVPHRATVLAGALRGVRGLLQKHAKSLGSAVQ